MIAVVLDRKARAASEGQSSDLCDNIDAFSSTIAALEKEMTRGSFQQGGVVTALRTVMNSEKVSNSDHSNALSFLSGGASDGGCYGPQSGEIVGILKQLMDETSVDLQTLEREELDRKTNHWALVKAKTGEISVLAKTIEEKMVRVETLAVEVEKMRSELFEAERVLFAKVKGLITCLINRLQAEAPPEASHTSYRDEGTSKATVKKEDFEADDVKHSSSFEAGVDGEISALQSEVGVFSESWLKMDITRADERYQECEELMIQRVQKNF